MAVHSVPMHTISIFNCSECAIVHSGKWQGQSGRRPGKNPGCLDSSWKCLLLSASVPGLGWSYWGCSCGPSDHTTQPADRPVSVHLHYLGVLPHDGQALYHVPINAADSGHPLAASTGRQVSLQLAQVNASTHTRYQNTYKMEELILVYGYVVGLWV